MNRMMLIAGVCAVAAAGLGIGGWIVHQRGQDPYEQCRATSIALQGGIGAPFELTAMDGSRVTSAELIDRPTLLYFGYTYCPDICPADALRNTTALTLLEDRGIPARALFVTIDPERDTPEQLETFSGYFDAPMTGLTGTPEELAAMRKDFIAYAAKGEEEDGFYLMDHSTYTYLMLPGHDNVTDVLRHDMSVDEVVETVACYADLAG